ncbi:Rab geranylgeranyltransferase [Xylographa trunciseda]|nr:Rab geranylgeranyltransferase [Xylographa trunciseda]
MSDYLEGVRERVVLLGISPRLDTPSWSAPWFAVSTFAYDAMTSHGIPRINEVEPRTEQVRQRELKKIEEYKGLIDLVEAKIQDQNDTLEALQLTSKLLTLNPEYYTIWNHRRRILQHQFSPPSPREASLEGEPDESPYAGLAEDTLELITSDLNFVFSLLRKFPKCYWIWNHRLWLLQQASIHLPASEVRKLWEGELLLVGKMLSLDNRNFHGWGYRRTVVAALERQELRDESVGASMVKAEFDYTTRMIRTSMSNFSAWHNRSRLIPRMLDELAASDDDRRKILDEELILIQEGLYTDSRDQSLWFYHQSLMCTFDPVLASHSMAPNLSKDDRLVYIKSETDKLLEMLEDDRDCKWIYQALIQLVILDKSISGSWPILPEIMATWVASLQALDPLRQGRWVDLEQSIRAT